MQPAKKTKRPNTAVAASATAHCYCCQQHTGQATLSHHLPLKPQALISGLGGTWTRRCPVSLVSRVAMITCLSAAAACRQRYVPDVIPPHSPVPGIITLRFPVTGPMSTNLRHSRSLVPTTEYRDTEPLKDAVTQPGTHLELRKLPTSTVTSRSTDTLAHSRSTPVRQSEAQLRSMARTISPAE